MNKLLRGLIILVGFCLMICGLALFAFAVVSGSRYLIDFSNSTVYQSADYILMIILSAFLSKFGVWVCEQVE